MSNLNLPPGVTENMIPGNRSEDAFSEKLDDILYEAIERWGYTPEEIKKKVDEAVKEVEETLSENSLKCAYCGSTVPDRDHFRHCPVWINMDKVEGSV